MNESLLECPFSAWKLLRYLFNFIKQRELATALTSKYYLKREGTFKIEQEKGKMKLCLSLRVRNQFRL